MNKALPQQPQSPKKIKSKPLAPRRGRVLGARIFKCHEAAVHAVRFQSMPIATSQARLSYVFRAFCLVLPPLSVLAQHGVVPLLLVASALACIVVWRAEGRLPLPDRTVTLALAALLLWCGIASFWGFDVVRSLVLTLRIGVIFGAGLVLFAIAGRLDDGVRKQLGTWFLAGILIGLALIAVELFFGYPISEFYTGESSVDGALAYRLNRGATAMAMMIWPAVGLLWQRGAALGALLLLAAVAVALSLMTSGAAVVGAGAGAATAALALLHRKAGHLVLVVATIVALTGSTLLAKEIYRRDWQDAEWLANSAQHRVEIWNYSTNLIAERPLIGWGFDAARAFKNDRVTDERGERQLLPLHPHNAPIQVWLELGGVGIVISAVLLMLLIRRIEQLPNPARICSQALFVSTLAIASTAYGLWQNQWLAMMWSAALLVPLTFRSLAGRESPAAFSEAVDDAAAALPPRSRQ